MISKDEAIHKALKVLNCLNNDRVYETAWVKGAINACEEALEQPAQEPVGKWESKCKCDFRTKLVGDGCRYCNTEEYIDKLHADYDYLLEENEQLLTHPHQVVLTSTWQGLTDDEIGRLAVFDGLHHVEIPLLAKFILAIEQALKDKNT